LGRIDHQVKLRGLRIELGEIEYALRRQEGVGEAVLSVYRPADQSDDVLTAYVVSDTGQMLDPGRLREALQAVLPDYMIPAYYVQLDELPLSPNGKLDRKSLPAPEAQALSRREYKAPETATERLLVEVWSEVLKLPAEQIGVHDNFFQLGGHSLSATRVVARLREQLQAEIALRKLFEHPVLANLAAYMATLESGSTGQSVLQPVDRRQPLPLSFSQRRLWLIDQYAQEDTSYNMPSALRLRGSLDVEALRRSFETLVERHESLRTVFRLPAGEALEPVQVILPAGGVEIPVEAVEADEVGSLSQAHAVERFSLSEGPLLKVKLLRVDVEHHVLLVNMHHIISDGWSLSVMTRELLRLYEAYSRGEGNPLPPLTLQYADYAWWQRQQDLGRLEDYWRERLTGYEDVLELPYDRPRPADRQWRAASVRVNYPAELSVAVSRFSQAHQSTLFMTLLGAFALVIQRYTQRQDLCIGTTIAGRDAPHLDELIGFFINILPLRVDLSGDPSGEELVRRVKEVSLEAYEHRALPFEDMLNVLALKRDSSTVPLVPVVLRHQNFPEAEVGGLSGGVQVSGVSSGAQSTAKNELDLQFFRRRRASVCGGRIRRRAV
jgi:hypothetical protein